MKLEALRSWIIFCLIGAGLTASGQNADSAKYRELKVSEINSWVHFKLFENNDDTCLFETKKINEKGLLTHVVQNYQCHGWGIKTETNFQYNDKGSPTMITSYKNDAVQSIIKLKYNADQQVIHEETKYFDPETTLIIENQYFGDPEKPDSMLSMEIRDGDTSLYLTTYTYENGRETRADVVDKTNNKPFSSYTTKYDSEGRETRTQYLMFQEYDNDAISLYEYNDKGQVTMSKSELDNTSARFWYDKKGLLIMTMYFNRFETLEREVWHKYTYRD